VRAVAGRNLALALAVLVIAVGSGAAGARAQGTFGPPTTVPAALPPPASPSPAQVPGDSSGVTEESAALLGLNPLSALAGAAAALPGGGQGVGGGAGEGVAGGVRSGGLSTAINVMLVLTVITMVPSIMLMCTCFLRIIVVLGLLKQALGTQTLPPPQVVTGLALVMTLLVMSPTIDRVNREAVGPYREGRITSYDELWDRAKQPVRDFMFDQIDASGGHTSLLMVLNYRGVDTSRPGELTREKVDMISLVPAFVLSELKVAFLMGFKVYLPFLVIDMVISSLLISMSMMMLPPVLISLPFKLLLFVLVDGWQLVVGSLLTSFARPEVAVALGSVGVVGVGTG